MRIILSLILLLGLIAPAKAVETKDLLYFVTFGRVEDVKLLLDQGANPNTMDAQGWPMLSVAVSRKDEEVMKIVEVLVAAGADINNGGPNEFYPLGVAIERNNVTAVKYLLDKKVNWQVNYRGKTPMVALAKISGNEEITQMMVATEEAEMKHQQYLHSDQHRGEMIQQYVFLSCAKEYWVRVLKTHPDSELKALATQRRAEHHQAKYDKVREMAKYSKLDRDSLTYVAQNAEREIQSKFSGIDTAREREELGLGNDEDAQKRCTKISSHWMRGLARYNLEGLGLTVQNPY